MLNRIKSAMVAEDGSLNLELALIIVLFVMVAIGGLSILASAVSGAYNTGANQVNAAV
jgi:Flp pilus assembly pilin Flp